MNKKTLILLIVMIISATSLSIVFAEENYIVSDSEGLNNIGFSDGYTGFAIESDKNPTELHENFTKISTDTSDISNYLKLSIIQNYRENSIENIKNTISVFVNGNYENSNDQLIKDIANSNEKIDDNVVLEFSNSSEVTFDFELLKSENENTSNYFAYKVTIKEIKNSSEILSAQANDTNISENQSKIIAKANNSSTNDKSIENRNNTNTQKVVNESNKTVVNKTTEVIVNQHNKTIINENNVKTINKTSNSTPENDTLESKLLQKAGRPIAILIAVIVLGGAIALVLHKKD